MSGLDDYEYDLPPERIAQTPAARRDTSRLLVLDRSSGSWEHRTFRDITAYLDPGDLLVLNETRVFPARLHARRPTGRTIEVLLLERSGEGEAWRALARPARALRPGTGYVLSAARGGEAAGRDAVQVYFLGRDGDKVIVEMRRGDSPLKHPEVLDVCEKEGEVPLPPYIRREEPGAALRALDRERYQTVFARETGAVAAPTAGLHFTPELLGEVRDRGTDLVRLTLHVGYGTFKPLTEEVFRGSTLHSEWVEIPEVTGRSILDAGKEGRRVVAVGTTSLRAVESFLPSGELPFRRSTDLFIKPGYRFRGVGALVTNFHLPRSSLLLLVCAFAKRDLVLAAYREAIREGYRFYSYGDAMLIV